jgi:hypothetical protein
MNLLLQLNVLILISAFALLGIEKLPNCQPPRLRKRRRSAIAAMLMLFAVSVSQAADAPKFENFRKGLALDTFVAVAAEDLTGDVDYGGGAGLNYFFTRGFGAGGRVIAWDDNGSTVDEIDARLIARAPLWDRVAPYGYVEGTYNCQEGAFKDGLWGAGAGGGIEFSLSKHIALKAEAGLRVGVSGESSFIGTGGLTIPF